MNQSQLSSPLLAQKKNGLRLNSKDFKMKEYQTVKTMSVNSDYNTPQKNTYINNKSSFALKAFGALDFDKIIYSPKSVNNENITHSNSKSSKYQSACNSPNLQSKYAGEAKFKTEICSNFKLKGYCKYGVQVFL